MRLDLEIDVVRTEKFSLDPEEFRDCSRKQVLDAVFALQPPGAAFVGCDALAAADKVCAALGMPAEPW